MDSHLHFDDIPPSPSVYDYATTYIESQEFSDATVSGTNEILAQGEALARHTVIIPIATHQEAGIIYPALAQYARQETTEPFSMYSACRLQHSSVKHATYRL